MPRSNREILQGVTYHCYTRCHNNKNLFHSSYVREYLIEAIQMCQRKYNFELIAAEPVGNHIHLIVRTLENSETISLVMQYIKARIAEKYNRGTGRTGSFWNERFESSIIERNENPDNYILWLLWYIGYKPVLKGLIRNPRYGYVGFINCYLYEETQVRIKITLHPAFISLGNSFEERVSKFLYFEDIYRKRVAVYF